MTSPNTTPPDHTDLSELRAAISKVLVKWNMPTRQAAISEILVLFKQYAQPPVVADEELDSLFKLLNDTFESEIDAQEFAIDEGEWMSLIKSLRIAEDKAKAALLQREQRLVAEAEQRLLARVTSGDLGKYDTVKQAIDHIIQEMGVRNEVDSYIYGDKRPVLEAQLRHNTNTGKDE